MYGFKYCGCRQLYTYAYPAKKDKQGFCHESAIPSATSHSIIYAISFMIIYIKKIDNLMWCWSFLEFSHLFFEEMGIKERFNSYRLTLWSPFFIMDVIIFIFQSDVSSSVVECKGSAFTDDSQPLVTFLVASSSVVLLLWSQYQALVYT